MPSVNNAISAVMQAQSSAVRQQIGYALLAKSQTATKQQGQAALELLNAAAQLNKSPGKGQKLDLVG
ncbi:MAG: hypothetical protein GXP26_00105 [Planctomycetes bacterium]|nr:hypothetical protein [Planctomycetota bacterium]